MTRRHWGWGLVAGLMLAVGALLLFARTSQPLPNQPVDAGADAKAGIAAKPDAAPFIPSYTVPEEEGRIYLSEADRRAAVARGLAPPGVQSILQVDVPMKHGQFVWQDDRKTTGELLVWVDLDRQLVSAYRDGHEIGTSVILYGADDKASPVGSFPILDKRERYHSRTYDAPMPYSLWLTGDGVAVHGSDVRWGRATHGCVGVPVDFARRLFAVAEEGDVVRIVRSSQMAPADPQPSA